MISIANNLRLFMKYALLFVLCLYPMSIIKASEIRQKSEAIIQNHFGSDIILDFSKLDLKQYTIKEIEKTVGQRFFRNSLYTWKVTDNKGLVGYAILDNVIGKSLPITFLVIFDPYGTILSTSVVKYRESIGGEISNWKWNQQFEGRNHESSFSIGKDIDGISGATISVSAMTKGIQKLTILFELIRESL